MRKRMDDIKGGFDIAPAANGGTVVALTVPLANK
jgi:signal transduction histidine kinase